MSDFGRRFMHGSLLVVIAAGVTGIAGYLIRRLMALGLTTEEYAFFYSMHSLLILLSAVARFGTADAALFLLPELITRKQQRRARLVYSFIRRSQWLFPGGLTLLMYAAIPLLIRFYLPARGSYLEIALFLPLLLTTAFETASQFALNSFKEFGVLNLLKSLKSILLLGGVALALSLHSLDGVIVVYVGLSLLTALTGDLLVTRWKKLSTSVRIPKCIGQEVLQAGAFYFLLSVGYAAINDVGTVALSFVSSAEEVALFNIAIPIAMIVRSLSGAAMVFTPLASELHCNGETIRLMRFFRNFSLATVAAMVLTAPLLWYGGDFLIGILFGSRFAAAKWSTLFLVEATLLALPIQMYLNFFNVIGRKKEAGLTLIPALCTAVIVLPLLCRFFGATGAGVAVLIITAVWFLSCRRRCIELRNEGG